jgi:hypothetical protein
MSSNLLINFRLANIIPFDIQEGNQRLITKFTDAFKSNPFVPLEGLLECRGLLTERHKFLLPFYIILLKQMKNFMF